MSLYFLRISYSLCFINQNRLNILEIKDFLIRCNELIKHIFKALNLVKKLNIVKYCYSGNNKLVY